MDKFVDILQDSLAPIAEKLNSNIYLSAIRDGFLGVMSLLVLGSIFLLLGNLPITGYADFMAGIFGSNWSSFFTIPFNMTMNIMTIFVVIGISKSLAKEYNIDDTAAMLWSLVAFFILTPTISSPEGLSGLPIKNFGAEGLFLGIIASIVATTIIKIVLEKDLRIKLPETVPANVAKSFDSLIPGLFVILVFISLFLIFKATPYGTAHNFIFTVIQAPLTKLGASLPATVLIIIAETLLFSFGLHGPNIVGAVMQPIWLALMTENATAFAQGAPLPNIVTYQFYSNYIKIGGCGATIGLALLTLFKAKSSQFKALGKLAIGPAIFNINEPLIFGMPIVLNPVLMIPFVLTAVVLTILSFAVMYFGFVPYTNGVNLPWTMPPILSGFVLGGVRGAIWQVIEIVISVLIYLPFFSIEDKRAYQAEQEANSN